MTEDDALDVCRVQCTARSACCELLRTGNFVGQLDELLAAASRLAGEIPDVCSLAAKLRLVFIGNEWKPHLPRQFTLRWLWDHLEGLLQATPDMQTIADLSGREIRDCYDELFPQTSA